MQWINFGLPFYFIKFQVVQCYLALRDGKWSVLLLSLDDIMFSKNDVPTTTINSIVRYSNSYNMHEVRKHLIVNNEWKLEISPPPSLWNPWSVVSKREKLVASHKTFWAYTLTPRICQYSHNHILHQGKVDIGILKHW